MAFVTLKDLNEILYEDEYIWVTVHGLNRDTEEFTKLSFPYCPDLTDEAIEEMVNDSIPFGYDPEEIRDGYRKERELSIIYGNSLVFSYDRVRHSADIYE